MVAVTETTTWPDVAMVAMFLLFFAFILWGASR